MFETAEVGNTIAKDQYKQEVPDLRVDLINMQYDLKDADYPVVVLVAGDDRPGCSEIIDLLYEWMDGRFIETHAFLAFSDEERERPRFWRYWRTLPRNGRIGVYFGAWAINTVAERVQGELDEARFEQRLAHISRFEQALTDDGAVVVKLWLHMAKKALKKRLEGNDKDSKTREWLVEESDWQIYRHYDEVMPVAGHLIRRTDTAHAPWHIIESTDTRYRNIAVARALLDTITRRLVAGPPASAQAATPPAAVAPEGKGVLASVDLSQSLPRDVYKARLDDHQAELNRLSRKARDRRLSSLVLFEGWDAGGKGGVIRRLTAAMAAPDYRIVPIGAPTDEERAHHYLWRFWRQLPRAGRMLILDRSWYGRVLVERVEQLTPEPTWRRAFEEINDFEAQLVEHGIPVVKFWLHIDPDEQLRRFEARERTPYKKHKITEEDYRNRARWDDYVMAVEEMVARTSTEIAAWTLIAGNDKPFARIQVLETVCRALRQALERDD